MKLSYYNYLLEDKHRAILYNCCTDQVLDMLPELSAIYLQHQSNPAEIAKIHPDFYAYLCDNQFIVAKDFDEQQYAKYRWKREEEEPRNFAITINPTMECNMQCWYCYEDHSQTTRMTEDTRKAIVKLVESVVQSDHYDSISLAFFGGEPLLYFRQTVQPLIEAVGELCRRYDKRLHVQFTTNAFLLSGTMLQFLKGYNVSFQITLDGNERIHNLVRHTKLGEKTYAQIVANIKQALEAGFTVNVRLNYIAKHLPSFIDVLADFQNLPDEQKLLVNFDFQRVWQDKTGDAQTIKQDLETLEAEFRKHQLYVTPHTAIHQALCYADRRNSIVINYDGRLYKCTARDFTEQNSEGTLQADGTMLWNEKYHKRMELRTGNSTCQACNIYPLCHGSCSQQKIENPTATGCMFGYTPADKRQVVIDRIRAIYAHNAMLNKRAIAEQ